MEEEGGQPFNVTSARQGGEAMRPQEVADETWGEVPCVVRDWAFGSRRDGSWVIVEPSNLQSCLVGSIRWTWRYGVVMLKLLLRGVLLHVACNVR